MLGGYHGPLPELDNHRGRPKEVLAGGCSHSSCQRTLTLSLLKVEQGQKGEGKDVVIKNGELSAASSIRHRLVPKSRTACFTESPRTMAQARQESSLTRYLPCLRHTSPIEDLAAGTLTCGCQKSDRPSVTSSKDLRKVYELIQQYNEGTLPLTRGLSGEEALELYVVNELSAPVIALAGQPTGHSLTKTQA